MTIEIEPYDEHLVPAVRAFNGRLRARGVGYRFPETAESPSLPRRDGRSIFQEYFLARDEDAVRGGYVFKHQALAVAGEVLPIGNYQFPVSEGIIDPEYAPLASRFLRHAMRKQPLLYSLGLGGYDEAITRLLLAGRWSVVDVPFYFRVFRARPFLRNIAPLRQTMGRRLIADAAALSGAGALGLFVFEKLVRPTQARRERDVTHDEEAAFGAWADELWARCVGRYHMMTVRDRATLQALYPAEQRRFIRLRVRRGATTIGWAVLLATQMEGNKYFGSMRVGTLVDCLAAPEDAEATVLVALGRLRAAGCDVAVTNQSHRAWCAALERCGFVAGPSNFLLALSPALARYVEPLAQRRGEVHITRGDGDGPYNL